MAKRAASSAPSALGFRAIFFSFTLFVSAALMFAVQPMIGKMMLPMVGGTASAWLVAVAFFQLALLAGYAFTHILSFLPPREHVGAVCLTLAVGLIMLPFQFDWQNSAITPDALDVFLALIACVSLPFFALSTVSSSLQRLFSAGGKADPYFLFAASNFGSFCGLLLYPFWIERDFGLLEQSHGWQIAYVALIALCAACMIAPNRPAKRTRKKAEKVTPLNGHQRGIWVVLAFIPSSLMLGLTSYITVEQGSLPLFWVIPLALYLLTFVIAFARHQWIKPAFVQVLHPLCLAIAFFIFLEKPFLGGLSNGHMIYPVLAFFFAALLCHMKLASLRPPSSQLTEYYLWVAIGGALGGSFNAFLAPIIFPLPIEFMLVILATCWLHPGLPKLPLPRVGRIQICAVVVAVLSAFVWSQFGSPGRIGRADIMPIGFVGTGIVCYGLFYAFMCLKIDNRILARFRVFFLLAGLIVLAALMVAAVYANAAADSSAKWILIALLMALTIISLWPRLFMIVAPGLAVMAFCIQMAPTIVDVQRNFFGVWRVSEIRRDSITTRELAHGSTIHDIQQTEPVADVTPGAYYDPQGPLGDIFSIAKPKDVGVVGLGAGAIDCYRKPGRQFTFYDIDPAIAGIAQHEFDYLNQCGPAVIIIGDGRRALAASDALYDLIIVDAFTSDMVPVHLLTEEAFQIYLGHLRPKGMLALHISNRYYNLAEPIANVADVSGLSGAYIDAIPQSPSERRRLGPVGIASSWAILVRNPDKLAPFFDRGWDDMPTSHEPVWTDDYSSVLPILKWRNLI